MNTMTATYIKNVSPAFMGEAVLFHLSPPLEGHAYVVSSAVSNGYVSETMVFPSGPDGQVFDWTDLAFTKRVDVEAPLIAAGYSIVRP